MPLFDLTHPIVQAPMAGGITTPELVAAASNAGALGSVGAAYLSPGQIIETSVLIRAVTSRPFAINLFVGGYRATLNGADPAPILKVLAEVHKALDLPPPHVPKLPPDPCREQYEAVIEARPAVFSFTFGLLDSKLIQRLKLRGVAVAGTATTVAEAEALESAGVDAIVAQGSEAGGHRGTFAGPFEASMVPTLDLVRQIRTVTKLPIIASGGLMDRRDTAAAIEAGASAIQAGTAFLACPESGASPAYKEAILSARVDNTLVTRALRNGFIDLLAGIEDHILPFPLQNALTRPMRTAAAQKGIAEYLSLYAGQGVARVEAQTAAEVVARLVP